MIGLDTNVLLAWLLEGQSKALPGKGPYRISFVVLAELVWTLRTTFRRTRSEIISTIAEILEIQHFYYFDREVFEKTMVEFIDGPADFSDYLLMFDNQADGCATTLTFDKKAGKHNGFTLLTEN